MTWTERISDRDETSTQTARRSRWSISMLLALLYVLVLVSPSLSYIGHGFVSASLLYFLWLVSVFFRGPMLRKSIRTQISSRRFELYMFACWMIFVFSNALLGRGYTGWRHFLSTVTLGMIIVMEIVFASLGDENHKTMLTLITILLGLETMRALPTLWSDPTLARTRMFLGGEVSERAALAGVGEYGFYTACAIGMPTMLAAAMEKRGLLRLLLLLSCGAIGLAVLLATFMGATLLMIVGVAFVVLLVVFAGRHRLRAIAVLLVIVPIGVILWDSFRDSAPVNFFLDKVQRQSSSVLAYGLVEGDLTGRAPLWESSLRTFMENPLFGIGPSTGQSNPNLIHRVSGHSSWLDIPAEYGLVGLGFYAMFLVAAIRRAVVSTRTGRSRVFSLACIVGCVLYIVGGAYNPVALVGPVNVMFFLFVIGGTEAGTSGRLLRSGSPS